MGYHTRPFTLYVRKPCKPIAAIGYRIYVNMYAIPFRARCISDVCRTFVDRVVMAMARARNNSQYDWMASGAGGRMLYAMTSFPPVSSSLIGRQGESNKLHLALCILCHSSVSS